jgi:hypothetical protein
MLTSQTLEQRVSLRNTCPDSSEINRLLAAGVVSSRFCALLLSNPAQAIAQGFSGEQFFLSPDEYNLVISMRCSSLQEFARQLCEYIPGQPIITQSSSASYNDPYSTMV